MPCVAILWMHQTAASDYWQAGCLVPCLFVSARLVHAPWYQDGLLGRKGPLIDPCSGPSIESQGWRARLGTWNPLRRSNVRTASFPHGLLVAQEPFGEGSSPCGARTRRHGGVLHLRSLGSHCRLWVPERLNDPLQGLLVDILGYGAWPQVYGSLGPQGHCEFSRTETAEACLQGCGGPCWGGSIWVWSGIVRHKVGPTVWGMFVGLTGFPSICWWSFLMVWWEDLCLPGVVIWGYDVVAAHTLRHASMHPRWVRPHLARLSWPEQFRSPRVRSFRRSNMEAHEGPYRMPLIIKDPLHFRVNLEECRSYLIHSGPSLQMQRGCFHSLMVLPLS